MKSREGRWRLCKIKLKVLGRQWIQAIYYPILIASKLRKAAFLEETSMLKNIRKCLKPFKKHLVQDA
jgi:hypothetical protein